MMNPLFVRQVRVGAVKPVILTGSGVGRRAMWPNPLVATPVPNGPGGRVRPEDAIRITTMPIAMTRWPANALFRWGTALHGPVAAVDVAVHRADDAHLTGGVVGFLYANGFYDRPSWNDRRGERPWATVRRDQVVRAWRRGGAEL